MRKTALKKVKPSRVDSTFLIRIKPAVHSKAHKFNECNYSY